MRDYKVRIAAALIALGCLTAAAGERWRWHLPPGVEAPAVPAENPMTAAKVALGRRLFYEADLSLDGTISCGACHEQHRAFADGNKTHPGVNGAAGRRNPPGLANIAWEKTLTWADPRLTTLEAQVAVPILGDHPVEMGMKGQEAEIARRLGRDGCYRQMFAAAFPETQGRIDMTNIARAIASFERTMIAFDTPVDRFHRGSRDALTPAAQSGEMLFGQHCASCHSGPNFADGVYHRIDPEIRGDDHGLAEVTGQAADEGKFRTPGLRNVALTAPYFHDGASLSLGEAIRRHGGTIPAIKALPESGLADIVEFLNALTDAHFVRNPDLAIPRKQCGTRPNSVSP